MGQFSWKCADTGNAILDYCTSEEGIKPNFTKKAYLLIPAEFGGGHYFVDNTREGFEYEGYGVFYDEKGNRHDAYVELARWNGLLPEGFDPKDDKKVQEARRAAIEAYFTPEDPQVSPYAEGNYNSPEVLKFPLKITESPTTYERAGCATDDPNQGWGEPCDEDEYNWGESCDEDEDE